MIILTEVATKISNILNGKDTEVGSSGTKVVATNPTDYYFQVETEGFHLDSIADRDKSKNVIPVFISTMGGQNNPVQGLKQSTCSIPITFYYPVRFKDDFYVLYDFLASAFVGTYLNYGTVSGVGVSNLSIAQYGELQQLDLTAFKNWVEDNFKLPIETTDNYMSMTVSLFITTVGGDFVFANEVVANLSYTYNNKVLNENVVFDNGSLQSNSQAQSEQVLGENEAQGLPFGVSYSSSFKVYYKDTAFYNNLLDMWFASNPTLQNLDITLTLTIRTHTFTRVCYLQSVVLPIQKGDVLAFTFTFLKKIVEEQQGE